MPPERLSSGRDGGSGGSAFYEQFLTAKNKVEWGSLGTAIAGGTLYAVIYAWLEGTLGALLALPNIALGYVDGAGNKLGGFLASVESSSEAVWSGGFSIDFGFLELPVSVIVVLVGFAVFAWGVSVWRRSA